MKKSKYTFILSMAFLWGSGALFTFKYIEFGMCSAFSFIIFLVISVFQATEEKSNREVDEIFEQRKKKITMYNCELHGKLDDDWCVMCEKFIKCNCSDKEISRRKDLTYGESDWTVTIYIEHCATCGQIFNITH